MKRYGGRTPLIEASPTTVTYSLPSGPLLCIENIPRERCGLGTIRGTGSAAHLRKLVRVVGLACSHCWERWSDSVEEMALAAQKLGYEYVGNTNHTPSLKIANGQSIENLRAQIRTIDTLNARLSGFRVLKSAEVDILADGALDLPDGALRELDYTVCSIHSRFAMNREQQTERVLRTMDNRYFTVLGQALMNRCPRQVLHIPGALRPTKGVQLSGSWRL